MKNPNPLLCIFILPLIFSCSDNKEPMRLLAGKMTEEKGLNTYDMNPENGSLILVSENDAGPNPSYFCISENNDLIYAANEVTNFKGGKGGGVTTLKYDGKTGKTEKIAELAIPNGSPCFISLSPGKKHLFLANYTGSTVTVIKLDDNGIPVSISDSLSFIGEGGKISHPHMILASPSGKNIYQTDLGLDHVVIYTFDEAQGKLKQIENGIVKLPEGSGPRHFVFNSSGTRLYVICELNSTLSVFNVTAGGGLELLQTTTTLADDFKGESFCADIHLSKDEKFLYGSNRGENTIVTFMVGNDGMLTLAGRTSCGGNWPRNFVVDPTGKFLLVANQRSGNITVLPIDKETGLLSGPGANYETEVPVCLKFTR